jgi:MoaA/NifB/PqqE/SkfB family radical SAM enzyme
MNNWFKVDEIGNVQLEITDYCNAFCPQCERSQIDPKYLNKNHLTLQNIKDIFDPYEWKGLRTVLFCGNKDEPTMNKDLIPMIKYLREKLPSIEISIGTNGGARSAAWWKELAQFDVCVKFGFDGLEDTNHIYRVGVKWEHAIRNMRAYIGAGGRAEWQFIIFEHNKHQIEEAKQMATKEGCVKFFEVISNRAPKKNKEGTAIKAVNDFVPERPKVTHCVAKICSKPNMFNINPGLGSIYITVHGYLIPCCWMGTNLRMRELHASAIGIDPDSHNIHYNNVQDIINGEMFYHIHDSLNEMPVCVSLCGKDYVYQGMESTRL